MYTFLIVIYAILCLMLIGLILIQRGRGSQTGLAYDPQASVFGASGSVSFIVKVTTVLSILFFALGIVISINFRDSLSSTAEESLIERAVNAEEEKAQDTDIPVPATDLPQTLTPPIDVGEVPNIVPNVPAEPEPSNLEGEQSQ